ncbi:MAG: terminase small subunit [Oscillospiraceae bacterium]
MKSKSFPIFRNAEEVNSKIERYFRSCEPVQALDDECAPVFDKNGAPVYAVQEVPLTVSGLAIALGFGSREELLSYRGKPFAEAAIRSALLRIENYAEERLFDKGQSSGAKYFLEGNFKSWCEDGSSDTETIRRLDEVLETLDKRMKGG